MGAPPPLDHRLVNQAGRQLGPPRQVQLGGADRIQSQAPAAVEVVEEPPRRTRKRRTATTSSLLGRAREGP
jgi:hypothetical protein